MVTRKELTGFKETLTAALQKAGYTAFGRIPATEETYNTYAHLPEQEMVASYVVDNNLDEINRVYRIIRFIRENSGNYFSLKNLCTEHGIDYKVFTHVVDNLSYIDKTGERRKTQYHWLHEEEPSFTAARDIVEHMQKLKSTKLSKAQKKKISQAVAEGISKDDFFHAVNIKKEASFSADAYFTYQKVQQQKQQAREEVAEIVSEDKVQAENSATQPEQEYQEQERVAGEPVAKDENVLTEAEALDEAGLQMENYILRQEIKYLRKINKAKDKLIKALRGKA